MRSLRLRLLLGTATASAALLAICSVLLYSAMRSSLWAEFDEALTRQVTALAAATEAEAANLRVEIEPAMIPQFQAQRGKDFFELLGPGGEVAQRSPSLGSAELTRIGSGRATAARDFVMLPNGRPGRAASMTFQPTAGDSGARAATTVTLILARDTGDIDNALMRLRRMLLAMCAIGTAGAMALMASVVGLALRPLDALAARIGAIDENELSGRVTLHHAPTELWPVIDQLNEMLEKVESAVARERCFSADVAHELRTPLAGLATALEVCISRSRDPREYQAIARRCLDTTSAMRRMIETLLTLARADAHQLSPVVRRVQLAPVMRECWKQFETPATERGLQIEWSVPQEIVIATDPDLLGLILRNLFDNAVTYADEKGTVQVDVSCDGGAIIAVRNTACALDAEQVQHVFERFWRADEARTGNGTHCGLGLGLCRKIAELLGGSIDAEVRDGLFIVRLILGAAEASYEEASLSSRSLTGP